MNSILLVFAILVPFHSAFAAFADIRTYTYKGECGGFTGTIRITTTTDASGKMNQICWKLKNPPATPPGPNSLEGLSAQLGNSVDRTLKACDLYKNSALNGTDWPNCFGYVVGMTDWEQSAVFSPKSPDLAPKFDFARMTGFKEEASWVVIKGPRDSGEIECKMTTSPVIQRVFQGDDFGDFKFQEHCDLPIQ